jgi:hypothetical protein
MRRACWRAGWVLGGALAAYVALCVHPQPLFAHQLQRGNIVLYARQPLPPEATPILDDALGRIRLSPLYDASRTHHVFLCDSSELYGFFARWNYRSGAVTDVWLGGNAFIRPANVERGRVIGRSGVEKGGERTLSYYIAHEVTHAMTADHTGRFGFRKLAAFQQEGYADYVAFARPVDVVGGRADMLAGTAEMEPARSGHYDRYRLLVGYLLQERKMAVDELLAHHLDRVTTENQLKAAKLAE